MSVLPLEFDGWGGKIPVNKAAYGKSPKSGHGWILFYHRPAITPVNRRSAVGAELIDNADRVLGLRKYLGFTIQLQDSVVRVVTRDLEHASRALLAVIAVAYKYSGWVTLNHSGHMSTCAFGSPDHRLFLGSSKKT